MTLETLLASIGVLGTIQFAYMMLKNAESRSVDDSSAWGEDSSSRMKQDFEIARAKEIMRIASEFGVSKAKA